MALPGLSLVCRNSYQISVVHALRNLNKNILDFEVIEQTNQSTSVVTVRY